MPLTQIQINTLKALLEPMDKNELDEALDMLLEEAIKRNWEENPTTNGTSRNASNNRKSPALILSESAGKCGCDAIGV